jgi:uncharacterized membrane protein
MVRRMTRGDARRMSERRQRLQRFGFIGLAAGLLIALLAPLGGAELAPMLRGYGLILLGTALYLVAGLAIASRFGRVTVERERALAARLADVAGSARTR